MKLGEALILRGDLQSSISELRYRIANNVLGQEGELPAEDPNELYREIDEKINKLVDLVSRINKTNNEVQFDDEMKLVDALAYRDGLSQKKSILSNMVQSASERRDRYSASEVKYIRHIDVNEVQRDLDRTAKEWREVDMRIQQINWTEDLI